MRRKFDGNPPPVAQPEQRSCYEWTNQGQKDVTNNHPLLLTPLTVGRLRFANRIVMPPMVTFRAKEDGLVTQAHVDHYHRSTGPGLIIVEGTSVLPEGRMSKRQLGIYSDRHIEGLARLARTIHVNGAVAGIQIHHAGAIAFAETRREKRQHIAAILFRLWRQQFMVSELHLIREAFVEAAKRAVTAGFDIIEIHGAHNYIFSQFLSPMLNRRNDQYGGAIKNRRRFLIDVFKAILEEVRNRAVVTIRIGVADGNKAGLSLSDGLSTAVALQQEGAQLLDISNGRGIPAWVRPPDSIHSTRLHLAQKARNVLQIPVIGGGAIRHPDNAEQALRDGMADLVWVGHGMLADPQWARKTIEGRTDKISLCLECKNCFHFTDPGKCPARRKKGL